jgi:hypothetical protein
MLAFPHMALSHASKVKAAPAARLLRAWLPALVALASALGACNQILSISPGEPGGSGSGGQGGGTGGATSGSTSTTAATSGSTSTTAATSGSTSTTAATSSSSGGTGGGADAGVVSKDGLVLLLHFDEASWPGPGTVKDASGHGNNATPTGMSLPKPTPDGRFGGAAQLDGNGYFTVPDATSLHFSKGITYSAWVFDMGSAAFRGIFAKRVGDGYSVVFTMFLQGTTVTADINGKRFSSSGTTIPNQWNHIAVTFDAATGQGWIYINGLQQGFSTGNPSFGVQTADLSLGVLPQFDPDSGPYFQSIYAFIGTIDEMAIWDHPLSQMDIGNLATATGPL